MLDKLEAIRGRFEQLGLALTKPEIDEAIRKYLHPEIATTVIAGTLEK